MPSGTSFAPSTSTNSRMSPTETNMIGDGNTSVVRQRVRPRLDDIDDAEQ